ncbi:MAG: 4Fe-4S binding protein [Bacteroidales bacterium]|nr:4Fe-4S binding protein [Bacteroidales bacterium]
MEKSLKIIRIVLAAAMLLGMTALLLDATGLLYRWLGWMPKVQLLPALLAGSFGLVAAMLVVTLLIGRFYCAVVCPMGVFQDIFVWAHKLLFGKKHPYRYHKPQNWLRYAVLAAFVLLMVLGLNGIAILIAPYSAYARMVTGLHATGAAQWVAIVTLAVIGVMSFVWGRLWCNTICPVGSLLSLVSRYRLFGIRIDADKCVGCHKCERGCKAMCIDIDGGRKVDHSRCVDCWNCLAECPVGAIELKVESSKKKDDGNAPDGSRRKFVAGTVAVGAAMAVQAQEQKMDGGLAAIAGKQVPDRTTPLKPFGARSLKHFAKHCTGCQLCVSQCPEKVLRPSTRLETFMQPELNYTDGYCRMACTRCSEVCPAGAIQPISKEEKTAISIGRAVVLKDNCIGCGSCARHCPAAAISMVDGKPAVNESRCLGCGACEYYCPARPVTAIYVEGREEHGEF